MKNIYKKFLLASVSVVLLAAGCQNKQAQDQEVIENFPIPSPTVTVTPSPSTTAVQSKSQSQTKNNAGGPDYQLNGQQPDEPINISVQQSIGGKVDKNQITVVQGMNALAFLKLGHKVETKTYSGIGDMVIGIDGVSSDSKHFWEFFVNGKSSNVGAGAYTLKNGDSVEWKFSEIK